MVRILIIDDEELFRAILSRMLKRAGYAVLDAPDGATGIALYRANQIDLVITDLWMPGKTGIEVITELRRDNPDIKVIAISGGGPRGDCDPLQDATKIGAQHAFLKPVNQTELLTAIKDL